MIMRFQSRFNILCKSCVVAGMIALTGKDVNVMKIFHLFTLIGLGLHFQLRPHKCQGVVRNMNGHYVGVSARLRLVASAFASELRRDKPPWQSSFSTCFERSLVEAGGVEPPSENISFKRLHA